MTTRASTSPRSANHALVVLVAWLGSILGPACSSSSSPPPPAVYPAPGPYPAPGAPTAAPPGAPAPAPATPAPSPSPSPAPVPAPVAGPDPINNVDLVFLRSTAQGLLGELMRALPPLQQARVQNVPLVVDSTIGEVNAFATCSGGRAAMAISDGLLEIQAFLARARAHDELAGTRKVDEYIGLIARYQRPKQPIVRPAAGFFDPRLDFDPRKLARQRQVLDEQIGFVLGHELAHHYLGHLPCTGSGALGPGDVARVLSDAVPLFNQPNELAADTYGLQDLLSAGARRAQPLTELGALLTMQFFSGLDQLSPVDILFAFERSHPPPALRSPVITQTANTWRATGGRGIPYPFF